MTREEYIKLAENPPVDERPSLFVLHVYKYAINTEHEYPMFRVNESRYRYLTKSDAEEMMKTLCGEERLYCFQITQLPMGVETRTCFGAEHSRLWLYDRNGELLDWMWSSSLKIDDWTELAAYRGRTENTIRFKPGDIIEFLTGNGCVRFGVVLYSTPSAGGRWDSITEKHSPDEITPFNWKMDFSDDRYLVIDEDYKCWGCDMNVAPTDILPLSLPLPDDMRQRLIAKYEWAAQGN